MGADVIVDCTAISPARGTAITALADQPNVPDHSTITVMLPVP